MCFDRLQTVLLIAHLVLVRVALCDILRDIHVRERFEVLSFQWNQRFPARWKVDCVALNVVMDFAVLAHQALRLDEQRLEIARILHLKSSQDAFSRLRSHQKHEHLEYVRLEIG